MNFLCENGPVGKIGNGQFLIPWDITRAEFFFSSIFLYLFHASVRSEGASSVKVPKVPLVVVAVAVVCCCGNPFRCVIPYMSSMPLGLFCPFFSISACHRLIVYHTTAVPLYLFVFAFLCSICRMEAGRARYPLE